MKIKGINIFVAGKMLVSREPRKTNTPIILFLFYNIIQYLDL